MKQHWLTKKGQTLAQVLNNTEVALIKDALKHSEGNVSKAAQILQVNRTTLTEKIKRFGIK